MGIALSLQIKPRSCATLTDTYYYPLISDIIFIFKLKLKIKTYFYFNFLTLKLNKYSF